MVAKKSSRKERTTRKPSRKGGTKRKRKVKPKFFGTTSPHEERHFSFYATEGGTCKWPSFLSGRSRVFVRRNLIFYSLTFDMPQGVNVEYMYVMDPCLLLSKGVGGCKLARGTMSFWKALGRMCGGGGDGEMRGGCAGCRELRSGGFLFGIVGWFWWRGWLSESLVEGG